MLVSMGEGQVKKYVWRCLLKVATDVAEWTDSERLFQEQDITSLAPVLVLILRDDRVILLFDLSEFDGSLALLEISAI